MERNLQDLKVDIKARSDLVEIVSQYTRLKRTGKNWTGLCPFHADKKPSFSVSPLGFYKCFSCQESGDVFTFVQKKENLDFLEALEFLAKRIGIPFERKALSPEKASQREQMLALNEIAVRFFQDKLHKSQDAQAYLASRGILKETQERFLLGYAAEEWEGLVFELQKRRADLALAAQIGLIKVRKQEGSGYYDTFRHRLIFPIQDVNGLVIAFGGRWMGGEEAFKEAPPAKYLNSDQSVLFDKSRTLYGLHFARKKLSSDTPAVFVEGYMDVVTTHQAGFPQCVATLGTSMTEEHARMLARYNGRVIICYDGDAAGIRATLRGASVWEGIGVEGAEVRVARLPAGDDPDSLLQRGETALFQAALDNAVPRVDFQIELTLQQHDLTVAEGRDQALAEAIPILTTVRSLTVRDRYAQKLAFLHPSHSYDLGRAVQQILADVEMYACQSRDAQSPRDRGYPLSEEANRVSLQEQPPPPAYRPPSKQNWGEWNPMTRSVIRRGEGNLPTGYGRGGPDRGPHDSYGRGGYGRRPPPGPPSDPTPPSLDAPALTGPEKAERQLLRALFSPDWRTLILSRLPAEALVTPQGLRLFQWIARTPANEEGGIDPRTLLQRAEIEENTEAEGASPFPEANTPGDATAQWEAPTRPFTKMSYFIREILEESAYLVSNERLNEAAVSDCIRRLQQCREEALKRELAQQLQRTDLTPEQQRACVQQYHQKMRAMRGSPSIAADE